MYPIDPFRSVHLIAVDLGSLSEAEAELELGRSCAWAMRGKDPAALLALALANCVWRGACLDSDALAAMVEVMIACGATGRNTPASDN
jgi:hypothetical protein